MNLAQSGVEICFRFGQQWIARRKGQQHPRAINGKMDRGGGKHTRYSSDQGAPNFTVVFMRLVGSRLFPSVHRNASLRVHASSRGRTCSPVAIPRQRRGVSPFRGPFRYLSSPFSLRAKPPREHKQRQCAEKNKQIERPETATRPASLPPTKCTRIAVARSHRPTLATPP